MLISDTLLDEVVVELFSLSVVVGVLAVVNG